MHDESLSKIDKFFAKYPLRRYEKGQILVNANEDVDRIYYIVSGQVVQYDTTDRGVQIVVNVYKNPAFFPFNQVVVEAPNLYFFEAFRTTEVREAPIQDVIEFVKNNADVGFSLIKRLSVGLEAIERRMAHAMSGRSINRVTFELITQCKRFGVKERDGSYLLDMHEHELASRAGLSRETVNRMLHILKRYNLVAINHKMLIVRDLQGLEDRLKFHL